LIVIRRLPEYEPRGRMTGWLCAITRHVAAKHRKKGNRELIMDDDRDSVEPPDAPDPEQSAADRDLMLRLLDALEPERRTVFVLHVLEDCPIHEIARMERIPVGTAWNRLRLAKEDLRREYRRLKARDHAMVPLFGLDQLIESERRAPPPPMPRGMEERVWARLQRAPEFPREEASGSKGVSSDVRAPPLAPAMPALTGGSVLAGGALIVLGIVIGAVWDPLHRPPATSAAPPPVPGAVETSSASATVAPSEPPSTASASVTPPSTTSMTTVAPSATPPSTASATTRDIAAERALLRKATDALAENNAAGALAAVEEHAHAFRGGRFTEEREAIRILALLRSGRSAEARAYFDRFARTYPGSPWFAELRNAGMHD